MTSTLPRAALAAAGLLTAAAACAAAAVATTPDPGGPRSAALPLPSHAAPSHAAAVPEPPQGREPAPATRSRHRTPLHSGSAARTRHHRPAHHRPAHHRPAHRDRSRHHKAPAGHATRPPFAAQAHRVLAVARAQRGKPYVWGAAGPRAFDCSGYVQWVYRRALGRHLPKYTDTQWAVLKHISRHELRPGDLVFVGGRHKSHVGIYAGHWRWWVAPHTGSHVKNQRIWPARHTFARVVHVAH